MASVTFVYCSYCTLGCFANFHGKHYHLGRKRRHFVAKTIMIDAGLICRKCVLSRRFLFSLVYHFLIRPTDTYFNI
uniref:Uncharacterized protein n=1 Tax=Anopheles albimanus TaxID=7167 RepID=A0A182FXJ0_ANOAL